MRLSIVANLLALAVPSVVFAQEAAAVTYVESLRSNVVHLEADGRLGFGFLVGIGERELVVATAWHTLLGPPLTREPTVCFDGAFDCQTGELVYVADPVGSLPRLDMAFVSVPYPDGLDWRSDALGSPPSSDDPVWVIGRGRQWYIPDDPGVIVGTDPDSALVHYQRLEVAEGVSGAPIVGERGIVALHIRSAGADAVSSGVAIEAARDRMEDGLGGTWILTPRAECGERGAERAALEGRSVTVRFGPTRVGPALEAMALLNCVGARALPRPIWSDEDAAGNGITYATGDLRNARALQSLLSSLGRLDTALGETEVGLEVRIR